MIIQELKLTNFRSRQFAGTEFNIGVNLIIGPNGAGKTNTLEAIHLLSTGESFRAERDEEMIYKAELTGGPAAVFNNQVPEREFARVEGRVKAEAIDVLEVLIVKNSALRNTCSKTYKTNGLRKRIAESYNYFVTVLFCPQDLELFTGAPAVRRKFMDDLLFKMEPNYKREHSLYSRALRQRNKVLEKINKTGKGWDELPFWTEKILASGGFIQKARGSLLKALGPNSEQFFNRVSQNGSNIGIEYKISELTEDRLAKPKEHEIQVKSTLVGPHKDDFELTLNGYNIAHFGSRGQQRTAVFAMKMSELEMTSRMHQSRPVLLLDDIFSELDDKHIQSLSEIVKKQQTIIASTHANITVDKTISLEKS